MGAPSNCVACPLHQYRTQVVNGITVGDGRPELLVVGEGPGVQEDALGRPFIGPTGAYLAQELTTRGITSYALSNATRCYPGDDKKDSEMAAGVIACKPYLMEDIKALRPKVVLALGAYALRALGFDDPMGTVLCHVLHSAEIGVPVVVSYHPAYFMRECGSLHLFDVALHKVVKIINGVEMEQPWLPQIVPPHKTNKCVIDTETTSLNTRKAEVIIALVTDDTGTVVVHKDNASEVQWLLDIWEDGAVEKGFQNGDYDIRTVERLYKKEIKGYAWDTMLAEHLLHEETHYNLELLRGIHTEQPVYERELRRWKQEKIQVSTGWKQRKVTHKEEAGVFKGGKRKGETKYRNVTEISEVETFKTVERGSTLDGYGSVPPRILVPYGVYDGQTEWLVWKKQAALLSDKKTRLLKDVVLPMQRALIDMEQEGIKIDVQRLPQMRQFYLEQEAALAKKVFEAAGDEFKLTSPPEVRKVLYEELGLPQPPLKSKKTGIVGTGKKSLDWLTSHANHPILEGITEWRATNQLIKAFLGRDENSAKGLMSNIEDGRLYTTFRLTLETGRNSSSPNLQNLPQMTKGPIRELLIADTGNVLLQADYSQIELRIAAYAAKDYALIRMLEDGADVHTIFARRLFPVDAHLTDDAWKRLHDPERTMAKRFTFGRLFGQGEQGMALTFNIPTEEAARFQSVYAELFPNMAQWWDDVIAQVRRGEPLETVWSRTRYFPAYAKFADIQWRGKNGLLSHMDRESLNFVPQATAADCLSKATGILRGVFKETPAQLRLVVHDALTVECPEHMMHDVARVMKIHMERVGEPFGFKLPVEVKWGYNWATENKLEV